MARADVAGRKTRPSAQAKTKAQLAKDSSIPPAAYSIAEFCIAHRISVDFYFRLQRDGLGPKVMRIGGRTIISNEAAFAWRRAREEQLETADKG
jgi:hypothetical protein